ncbi:MAG: hypothetical protein AAF242_15385, partial [Bacteroidota bacterium]
LLVVSGCQFNDSSDKSVVEFIPLENEDYKVSQNPSADLELVSTAGTHLPLGIKVDDAFYR